MKSNVTQVKSMGDRYKLTPSPTRDVIRSPSRSDGRYIVTHEPVVHAVASSTALSPRSKGSSTPQSLSARRHTTGNSKATIERAPLYRRGATQKFDQNAFNRFYSPPAQSPPEYHFLVGRDESSGKDAHRRARFENFSEKFTFREISQSMQTSIVPSIHEPVLFLENVGLTTGQGPTLISSSGRSMSHTPPRRPFSSPVRAPSSSVDLTDGGSQYDQHYSTSEGSPRPGNTDNSPRVVPSSNGTHSHAPVCDSACEWRPGMKRKGNKENGEGYKSIGSFHTENVDDMIKGKAPVILPEVYFSIGGLVASEYSVSESTPLGPECRPLFLLDPSWTFLNHAAFGAPLRSAARAAQAWREYIELQPLKFFDRELFPLLVDSTRKLAEEVGADPTQLVLLPNVTFGLNAVLQSFLHPSDRVLSLELNYGATKKILEILKSDVTEVRCPVADWERPTSIVDNVRNELHRAASEHRQYKLLVIDHITSNTALVLPAEDLVHISHQFGVPVLVDGAHAVGSIPLQLKSLGADFYVGNCHKWFSNPRGCAFLYTHNDSFTKNLRPPVLSHGALDELHSRFVWWGNTDYSPILAVAETIRFWNCIGADRCSDYCRGLLRHAIHLLCRAWDVKPFRVSDGSWARMALVPLPANSGACNSADAKLIQDELHNMKIEVPVKAIDGGLCVRISAQIYNGVADFDRLANAVNVLRHQYKRIFTGGEPSNTLPVA